MSGQDNLLAAVAGAAEGFGNTYASFKKAKYESDLLSQRQALQNQNELGLYQQKLPLQRQSDLLENQGKLDQELAQKRAFLPEETKAKIDIQKASADTMVPILDGQGNITGYAKKGAIKLPIPKAPSAQSDKNQKDIALLQSTLKSFDSLMGDYKTARGDSGAMASGAKSVLSAVTRGAYDPAAKTYNDRKREFIQSANKQLTGSSRGTQLSLKSAIDSMPEFFESPESAGMKGDKFRQLIQDRIDELGGSNSGGGGGGDFTDLGGGLRVRKVPQ